jgi:UDP-N-acetylglucosamine acyltransferase
VHIPPVLEHLTYRYPSVLVDAVTELEPGRRILAVKNVTVNEEFFQGHFPGTPLMPGVLMIESLAQVATLLLFCGRGGSWRCGWLRGVDRAKFRRQVVPGDRLELEVTIGRRRGQLVRATGVASVAGQTVAEMQLVLALEPEMQAPPRFGRESAPAVTGRPMPVTSATSKDRPTANVSTAAALRPAGDVIVHETAIVHPMAQIGAGTVVGPYATIGGHVRIGRNCQIGAASIIDGWTEIGDHTQIYPMASIGLAPQDLKYKGEPTRLIVGEHNVFREFVTIHRGTAGGGGVTSIGHHNLFMAYAHVAHDCHIGNNTIFGNAATLGGHVNVEDFATISAYSGVHQFCRVGQHAFIGGYTVVTRDALPYAKTVGNRARIYGVNSIGLARRGFSPELIGKLRRAYRHLVQHNTSRALELIERDQSLAAPEVTYLVQFITSARRGVILRRPSRRVDDVLDSE